MAKVEMSLVEYDQLRGELEFLRRVVKEITSPKPSDWDLEYCRKSGSIGVSSEITSEVQNFLNQQILENLPEELVAEDLIVKSEFSTGSIVRVEVKPEEESSEDESNWEDK